MQKLSLISVLALLALAGLGIFIVTVYNPFNSSATSLQHPILSSHNSQPSGTNIGSTPSGNSTSTGSSLLTNSPPTSSGTSNDGGITPDS